VRPALQRSSRTVDRLERAGHVERVRDTADRRRVVLTETAAARAASYAAWSPVIREIDEVCRALSEDEKEFARDLLARLRAAVERSGRDDAPGPLDSAR
jgi:DNA-binding MarR family transcriptional regulator